jgi:hypothetical protein
MDHFGCAKAKYCLLEKVSPRVVGNCSEFMALLGLTLRSLSHVDVVIRILVSPPAVQAKAKP